MSADNWAICPKCTVIELKNYDKRQKLAKDAYGKVSEEEYRNLVKKASEPVRANETLREDYYIGIDRSGKFSISYGCFCDKCGFKYSFNHKEQLDIKSKGE